MQPRVAGSLIVEGPDARGRGLGGERGGEGFPHRCAGSYCLAASRASVWATTSPISLRWNLTRSGGGGSPSSM